MSSENVELVRRIAESLGGREVVFPPDFLDSDVEWVNPSYGPKPRVCRGKPAFENAAATLSAAFHEVDFEIEEVIDGGDSVLVLATFVIRERTSVAEHRQQQGYVWTLRDGKAMRFQWFNSHAEAFEAVGLQEHAASRANVDRGRGETTDRDALLDRPPRLG